MRPVTTIAVAVVLSFAGCEREAIKYAFASVAELPRPSGVDHWEYVETLGNSAGPFKATGGNVLNSVAKPKRVWYRQGGSRIEKDLDLKEEVLIEGFENAKGDSVVMVYKRRPS
jgi:hypothetical protein